MKRWLAAIAVAAVAACATSPQAPPAPTPALTPARFFTVDPTVLRAAVLTDPRALFLSVDLDVTAALPQQPRARYVIRLQRRLAFDPRLPPPPPGRAWQVFALDENDAVTLVTVQRLLLSQLQAQAPQIELSVSARPALVPADLAGALPMRVDLLLDDREGWFTQVGPTLLDTRPGTAEKTG